MRQPRLFSQDDHKKDFLFFEKEAFKNGWQLVAGIDEAGRGPLAGPVVAVAVVLPHECLLPPDLNDSKKLSPLKRQMILKQLHDIEGICIGIGVVSPQEIDKLNILNATHLAMKKAVLAMSFQPNFCLVDGLPVKGLPVPHKSIVKGDSRRASIAAASIVAKEYRDDMMASLAKDFPGYGFEKHKGYSGFEWIIHCDAVPENEIFLS